MPSISFIIERFHLLSTDTVINLLSIPSFFHIGVIENVSSFISVMKSNFFFGAFNPNLSLENKKEKETNSIERREK